jgi:hypothetical protein
MSECRFPFLEAGPFRVGRGSGFPALHWGINFVRQYVVFATMLRWRQPFRLSYWRCTNCIESESQILAQITESDGA